MSPHNYFQYGASDSALIALVSLLKLLENETSNSARIALLNGIKTQSGKLIPSSASALDTMVFENLRSIQLDDLDAIVNASLHVYGFEDFKRM